MSLSPEQDRADQIRYFNQELDLLKADQVLRLSSADESAIQSYHQNILKSFTFKPNLDLSENAKTISLGMRGFSLIAATALMVSLFFLFEHYWDHFSVTGKIITLIVASLGSLGIALIVKRRDDYGYYTQIAAVAAMACFTINLIGMGVVFNLPSSMGFFLALAIYGWLLAHIFNVAILLWGFCAALVIVVGMVLNGTFLGGIEDALTYPEKLCLAAPLLLIIAWLEKRYLGLLFFSKYIIATSWLLFFIFMVLVTAPDLSFLSGTDDSIKNTYRVFILVASATSIFSAIKIRLPNLITAGVIQLIIFIFVEVMLELFDFLPQYAVFLLISLFAIAGVMLLKRLHAKEFINKVVNYHA